MHEFRSKFTVLQFVNGKLLRFLFSLAFWLGKHDNHTITIIYNRKGGVIEKSSCFYKFNARNYSPNMGVDDVLEMINECGLVDINFVDSLMLLLKMEL